MRPPTDHTCCHKVTGARERKWLAPKISHKAKLAVRADSFEEPDSICHSFLAVLTSKWTNFTKASRKMILSQLHPVLHSFPASWLHVYARSIDLWTQDRISVLQQSCQHRNSPYQSQVCEKSGRCLRAWESVCVRERERCVRVRVHEKPQPDGHPTLVSLSASSPPLPPPMAFFTLSPASSTSEQPVRAGYDRARRLLSHRPLPSCTFSQITTTGRALRDWALK